MNRDKKGHLVKLVKNAPVVKPEKPVNKAMLKRMKRREHSKNKDMSLKPIVKVFESAVKTK